MGDGMLYTYFFNTYMPNLQCLYTSIVLHTSFTYTHKIMNRHIHMHTYIYAHIYIYNPMHKWMYTYTSTPELTNMHAQTYHQITHTWLYTYANIHIKTKLHIYTYAHTFMPTHKQTIYARSNIYTLYTEIYIHAHIQ